MYKVDFSLNEWNFTIKFNNEQDHLIYKDLIAESVINMKHKLNNLSTITIEYLNDQKLYENIYNNLNLKNKKTISSFMNEYYDKYDEIFVSSEERYLIRKTNNTNFEIVCKQNYKRPELIYIIREIYVRLEENKQSIFIHGNGINIDNKGLIIAGNSGSGKTTFMLKLFEAEKDDFSYLSNDRVFITNENKVDYFPIPLILANGTARNINTIYNFLLKQEKLDDSSYDLNLLLNGKDDEKYALHKKYLREIFPKCNIEEQTELNTIILPKMNFNINDIKVIETKNYEDLIPICFTPVDHESLRKPWIQARILNDSELATNSEEILKKTIKNNSCFKVEYNPNIDSKELSEKVKKKVLERL